MAAVAGPTQEATTELMPVPTDLPPSLLQRNTSQRQSQSVVPASGEADDNAVD